MHRARGGLPARVRSAWAWSARGARAAALAAIALAAPLAGADPAATLRDADLKLGERLISEHRCAGCHIRRVGGDGSAIYQPRGRINTPAALLAMVDYCSQELSLGLFPEEIAAMAAVLQRDHYRFDAAPAGR
jgi:mono/diheme cytochrome c family protein